MNTHAVLIIAFDNPTQTDKLIRALAHDRLNVYVHWDRKTLSRHTEVVDRFPEDTRVISTRRVFWGGYSLTRAALDLLEVALEDERNLTFSLISGADYPVKSTPELVRVLDATMESRIDHWRDEDPSWMKRHKRFFYYDYPMARYLNALSRRLSRVLPARKPPSGLELYFGWTWWTLTRDGGEAVLRFMQERQDVVDFYRHTHIPDESFFQTALMNVSGPPAITREHLRFIDFQGGQAHPRILGFDDIEALCSGPAIFARKFDERVTPHILEAVDAERNRLPAGHTRGTNTAE